MRHLLRKNNEFWTHERSLTALLVYMCLGLFVWIVLGEYENDWWAFLISNLIFDLILVAGLFAVITRWRNQLLFIAIALLAGGLRIVAFVYPDDWIVRSNHALAILFLGLLARLTLSHVFKEGPMNFYRIQGSVVVFMIIGIIYALLYTVLESVHPGSFMFTESGSFQSRSFSQLLYFSFVTMTTLGIGDMIPASPMAKALVVFQSVIGLLYPVVMIARLVSMEVAQR